MNLTLYQIDAFASKAFEGNPAAVCPLDKWLPDSLMQSIAAENNLSETAFFVRVENYYQIRWFTPVSEVSLCGHATLASAYVIFEFLDKQASEVLFESHSGQLRVVQNKEWLEMDFPAQPAVKCSTHALIIEAFGVTPIECLKSEDYVVVFENEETVMKASPDLSLLLKLDLRGVMITSKSKKYDFITRFFAPKYGIDEDPVTGSAFTKLIPYWSEKLSKKSLNAKQVSAREGEVKCHHLGDRVKISGKAVKYLVGTIEVKG